MSTGKRLIYPTCIIGNAPINAMSTIPGAPAGDMSQVSIISPGLNIQNFDNIGIQLVWPTTAVGTLVLNGSGYNGGFQPLPGFSVTSPSGSNTGTLIDIVPTSMFWLQIVYTKISGTGTLSAWFWAKAN